MQRSVSTRILAEGFSTKERYIGETAWVSVVKELRRKDTKKVFAANFDHR